MSEFEAVESCSDPLVGHCPPPSFMGIKVNIETTVNDDLSFVSVDKVLSNLTFYIYGEQRYIQHRVCVTHLCLIEG